MGLLHDALSLCIVQQVSTVHCVPVLPKDGLTAIMWHHTEPPSWKELGVAHCCACAIKWVPCNTMTLGHCNFWTHTTRLETQLQLMPVLVMGYVYSLTTLSVCWSCEQMWWEKECCQLLVTRRCEMNTSQSVHPSVCRSGHGVGSSRSLHPSNTVPDDHFNLEGFELDAEFGFDVLCYDPHLFLIHSQFGTSNQR
jgi:hypothetical protein